MKSEIRLLGIDTPEKENCMYDQARAFLQKLASGKHVRLKNSVKDSYGRLLANVIVEDFPVWINYLNWRYFSNKSLHPYPDPDPYLNRGLIVAGLARDTGSKILKQAEIFSKDRQLGIWSGECIQLAPANSDCQIKGNINFKGEKIYHNPGQQYYDKTQIDESAGERMFCSEKEAEDAGWRRSKV